MLETKQIAFCLALAGGIVSLGLGGGAVGQSGGTASPAIIKARLADCDACKIVLVYQAGEERIDKQIAELQTRIKTSPNPAALVERLGWLFVSKARTDSDPGFYKLAEQCALCLQASQSNSPETLLLQGHVLHSLHRFHEAEPLARLLVKTRGAPVDFGLWGDVNYDLGNLPAAIQAYQRMVNLRPDLQSYSRVAKVRWMAGDLEGAIEAMSMAVQAGSVLNAEPTAWSYSQLALYQLQAGNLPQASQASKRALELLPDYPTALAAAGRVQSALGDLPRAIASFEKAATLSRLPDHQWLWADSLRLAGKDGQAVIAEAELLKTGAAADPRTFSLYLATRGREAAKSLDLAQREEAVRADVFTDDALAWALRANGQIKEAKLEMDQALADGTQDARLFFHASVIAKALGQDDEAARLAAKASAIQQMLYPSEQTLLVPLTTSARFDRKGAITNDPTAK